MSNTTELEITALKAAIRAANAILSDAFGEVIQHDKKHRGIVTKFDVAAEEEIKKTLQQYVDYPFLAEETAAASQPAQTYWIIDPIDGTTAFAHGNPLFACSIALVRDGQVILSTVSNPAYDETYFFDGEITTLNDKKVSTSPNGDIPIAFIDHGYAIEDEILVEKLGQLLRGKVAYRRLGTTALEMAYVAGGRADVVITIGDEMWDYAGGIGLIKGAGGVVKDFRGYNIGAKSHFMIAGDPKLVEELIPLISSLQS